MSVCDRHTRALLHCHFTSSLFTACAASLTHTRRAATYARALSQAHTTATAACAVKHSHTRLVNAVVGQRLPTVHATYAPWPRSQPRQQQQEEEQRPWRQRQVRRRAGRCAGQWRGRGGAGPAGATRRRPACRCCGPGAAEDARLAAPGCTCPRTGAAVRHAAVGLGLVGLGEGCVAAHGSGTSNSGQPETLHFVSMHSFRHKYIAPDAVTDCFRKHKAGDVKEGGGAEQQHTAAAATAAALRHCTSLRFKPFRSPRAHCCCCCCCCVDVLPQAHAAPLEQHKQHQL